jgi:CarD family transcriptional regulator
LTVAFKVGSKVVYPSHGVAKITGREKRVVDGKKVSYLVLSVPQRGWGTSGDMKLSVPEDRAEDLGVRTAIPEEEATDVLEVLAVTDVRVPSNWSRRFKNHQEKLKSGDVYQCAEVVRNLALRQRSGSLSAAEKSMYANARHLGARRVLGRRRRRSIPPRRPGARSRPRLTISPSAFSPR